MKYGRGMRKVPRNIVFLFAANVRKEGLNRRSRHCAFRRVHAYSPKHVLRAAGYLSERLGTCFRASYDVNHRAHATALYEGNIYIAWKSVPPLNQNTKVYIILNFIRVNKGVMMTIFFRWRLTELIIKTKGLPCMVYLFGIAVDYRTRCHQHMEKCHTHLVSFIKRDGLFVLYIVNIFTPNPTFFLLV